MSDTGSLRQSAEALSAPFPPLLAAAEHLAASVVPGSHGRRRVGQGDEFWQYRPSHAGDTLRQIDWRRSAKADDALFVREKEWQAAQSVMLWLDLGQSMEFASTTALATKADVARQLVLATAILLVRAGEKVGLSNAGLAPQASQVQLERMGRALLANAEFEYTAPTLAGMPAHARAVFLSDFLGDIEDIKAAIHEAADRGVEGAIVQVLDPQEEAFPFDGRTIFESVGGSTRHETLKAGNLRDRYLQRLAERKEELREVARGAGWQYYLHHTDQPTSGALLWLYSALEHRF